MIFTHSRDSKERKDACEPRRIKRDSALYHPPWTAVQPVTKPHCKETPPLQHITFWPETTAGATPDKAHNSEWRIVLGGSLQRGLRHAETWMLRSIRGCRSLEQRGTHPVTMQWSTQAIRWKPQPGRATSTAVNAPQRALQNSCSGHQCSTRHTPSHCTKCGHTGPGTVLFQSCSGPPWHRTCWCRTASRPTVPSTVCFPSGLL